MNRDKALSIADRIMTRIETDRAIHKDSIADEIVAGDALNEQTMPPALAIGTARVAGDKLLVWDGKQWWQQPSCVTSGTVSEPEIGELIFVNGELVLSEFVVADSVDDRGFSFLKEMSDRAAIQKAWHEVMARCKAWPPADVIQSRINKIREGK